MISISCEGNRVALLLTNVPPAQFAVIMANLRTARCRYQASTHKWLLTIAQYDNLKETLEELDILQEQDPQGLVLLREGIPELTMEAGRVVADYSLLRYPPIEGKAPHEKFQRESIVQGLQKNRYGFFLGQGSGKSYIAAAIIAHRYLKEKKVSKILVLSTAIGARNLYHEFANFIPQLDVARMVVADKNNWQVFTDQYDIVIASYNTFRLICNRERAAQKIRSKTPRKPFLGLETWGKGERMLLLDESHIVANSKSQQGALVALHSTNFYYRYLFSGTPADKPEKLYNQLKILDPVLVHNLSYSGWLDMYAELGTRFSAMAIREWKHDKFEELNQRVRSMYATFLKSEELLNLPPHYIKKIFLNMSPKHRRLYESFIESEVGGLMKNGRKSVRDIVNRFPFMMLAVDNPWLLENHREKLSTETLAALSVLKPADMERVAAVKDIVESHDGEKGVLWVTHPKTAELYAEIFAKEHPILITREVADSERKNMVDEFQKDPTRKLLIANIELLSTSITITAAQYQVYIERSFAYISYDQSIKRIYRIGQNKSVTTYILLYANSLDILRDKNLSGKGAMVSGLLGKKFLTQEEWKEIFNGDSNVSLD